MAGAFGSIDEALSEPLKVVDDNAKRIHFLTRRLVALMRQSSEKPQKRTIDICDIIQKVLSSNDLFVITRRTLEDVEFAVDCQDISFRVDAEAFYIMLFELIHNAIKFRATKVTISVLNGEELSVSVKDDGIGIAKKDQRRVFNLGEQVDMSDRRKFEGTGTGLHVLQKLIEWHDGYVELESELDIGSEFVLQFPVDEQVITLNRMAEMRELVG